MQITKGYEFVDKGEGVYAVKRVGDDVELFKISEVNNPDNVSVTIDEDKPFSIEGELLDFAVGDPDAPFNLNLGGNIKINSKYLVPLTLKGEDITIKDCVMFLGGIPGDPIIKIDRVEFTNVEKSNMWLEDANSYKNFRLRNVSGLSLTPIGPDFLIENFVGEGYGTEAKISVKKSCEISNVTIENEESWNTLLISARDVSILNLDKITMKYPLEVKVNGSLTIRDHGKLFVGENVKIECSGNFTLSFAENGRFKIADNNNIAGNLNLLNMNSDLDNQLNKTYIQGDVTIRNRAMINGASLYADIGSVILGETNLLETVIRLGEVSGSPELDCSCVQAVNLQINGKQCVSINGQQSAYINGRRNAYLKNCKFEDGGLKTLYVGGDCEITNCVFKGKNGFIIDGEGEIKDCVITVGNVKVIGGKLENCELKWEVKTFHASVKDTLLIDSELLNVPVCESCEIRGSKVENVKEMYYKTLTGETVENQKYLTDDSVNIKKPVLRENVTVKNERATEIEL